MKLAAQLYSVHDYTQSLKDFDETLSKIAKIGYKYVQVSGTCPFKAKWLKETLDKYGLKCIITHTPEEEMQLATKYVIEDHDTFDCKYIGLGGMPYLWDETKDMDWVMDNFYKKFIPIAKQFKEAGKYFMYHNHNLEFVKNPATGKTYFDEMIENTDPELVGFTVDTYWIQAGGGDPTKYIKKLAGRCPVVHFKDYKVMHILDRAERIRLAAIGDGSLDWDSIVDACKESGVEYIAIEQDDCYGEDPFECLAKSYKFLNEKYGLE